MSEAAVEAGAEATQAGQSQQQADTQDLESLPEWARAAITKANTEAAKYRTRAKELEPKASEYDKLAEAQKTEQQKAAEARQAAEARATEAETRLLRYQVAAAKNLPADLVQFLTGSSQEDIEKQADALVARLGETKPQTPSFDGGSRQTAPTVDMNAAIRRAAGR